MPQRWSNLDKRLQHEAPFEHARMRNRQLRSVKQHLAEQENIDVDGPRPFRNGASAAVASQSAFDPLRRGDKLNREQPGFTLEDHVQEPWLLAQFLGLGFVDGGPPHDVHFFGFEGADSPFEITLAVAHVRPERQKDALQRHSLKHMI